MPDQLLSLRKVEILAFLPHRGTLSTGHVPPADGNAFDRSSKVGVVKTSNLCWGGTNFFLCGMKKTPVLRSARGRDRNNKKNRSEKSLIGLSYTAFCPNLAYNGNRREYCMMEIDVTVDGGGHILFTTRCCCAMACKKGYRLY